MLHIKELKTDKHDFFQTVNSYKKLLKVMDEFWQSEKNGKFAIRIHFRRLFELCARKI